MLRRTLTDAPSQDESSEKGVLNRPKVWVVSASLGDGGGKAVLPAFRAVPGPLRDLVVLACCASRERDEDGGEEANQDSLEDAS